MEYKSIQARVAEIVDAVQNHVLSETLDEWKLDQKEIVILRIQIAALSDEEFDRADSSYLLHRLDLILQCWEEFKEIKESHYEF